MGLKNDVRDWLRLRDVVFGAWRLVRDRRRAAATSTCEVRFRDGTSMTLHGATHDRRVFVSIFARDEYRMAPFEPGALDTVIDVGAHVGIFARRAASCARRVLSYEPAPATYALLAKNVAACPNVTAHHVAVTNRAGVARLHVFEDPSENSVYPLGRGNSVEVKTTTIAEIFEQNAVETCDLLKLDVEGAEYPIVFDTPDGLWRRVARVAMEYHPVPGAPPQWTADGIAARLRAVGHDVVICPRSHHPGKGLLFSSNL